MYARKQTNIMRHKHWHPQNFSVINQVYEAEEKAALENRKLKERQAERDKEREIKYYQSLREEAGMGKERERVDWMYEYSGGKQQKSGVEMVVAEEAQKPGDMDFAKTDSTPKLGSMYEQKTGKALAVDLDSKIRDDPMLRIQQMRMKALQDRFNNPMYAVQLQKKKEEWERKKAEKREKKEKKEKKKEKKEKKEKKKKKRSRSSSSERSVSHDKSMPSTMPRRSPSPLKPQLDRKRRKPLTSAEREEKLREMQADARDLAKKREVEVNRARQRDREEEEEMSKRHGGEYLKKMSKEVMSQSMASRVTSQKYFSRKDASFHRD